ncbi:hypothetical protein ACFQ5J_03355 [Lacticaseibacillus baoqingensis]|uniref:Glycosyltransferase RgtA/B/C/D-like domain-containing protein n=1 Tax=Lacticaseibacillus baoqingensis TaxID=2486013 RepID=A0ABW4E2W2_9LACO|nr:hypothetical protein [Lacticaseibacillus baoqingensis]
MRSKHLPAFLPTLLALCLIIGSCANLRGTTGIAVALLAAAMLGTISLLAPAIAKWPLKWIVISMLLGALVMLGVQIALVNVMPVSVYHDPYRVIAQADHLAAGHWDWPTTYFGRYPNNVPLTYLLSRWLLLGQLVGLSTNAAVQLLSLIILDGFIALMLLTVWQMAHRKSLLLGTFAFLVLTPFAYTYYLQVFYSDLPMMLLLRKLQEQVSHPMARHREMNCYL